MSDFVRDLPLNEWQWDALWTCIDKKEEQLNPLEQVLGAYGDAWVWIACSPGCTLGPAWQGGERTLRDARPLIVRLKSATDEHMPFCTSDNVPPSAAALLAVSGAVPPPPRRGSRGRLPTPRQVPPPDLGYAVVVQERKRGHVVNVTPRLGYGSQEHIQRARHDSPVRPTRNTAAVERNNLSVRQHARRLGRKGNACSKDRASLAHQCTLAFAYSHVVIPPRSLRQRLPKPIPTQGPRAPDKKWREVTPAMAAALTDHVWTMDELLSFHVPPKHLW
jgi:IS1 family transposase